MANSKISIANTALGLINEPEIQNFEQPTNKTERIVKNVFDDVYAEVLSEFPWNCNTTTAKLAESANEPVGFTNSFAIPNTPPCLRVLKIEEVGATDPNWERRGNELLIDSDSCTIKYLYLIEDVTQIPPHIVRCISTLLASRIAVPVLGLDGQGLASYYQQLYTQEVRPNAQYLDANEGKAQHNEESTLMGGYWIDGHFFPSAYSGELDFVDVEGI